MTRKPEHLDWDDPEQIELEEARVFEILPHLKETAATQGNTCPKCGSTNIKRVGEDKPYAGNIHIQHCKECETGWTRYEVDQEKQDHWSPEWHSPVTSYAIEDYPYYLYFKPDSNIFEGIGPNIFPWEQ